uniref:Uncharacterized protein n=1 Tax=Escherichia coli TaxID=562 RepID=A0A385EMU9_ECOLX|nr:hypothetical protein GIDALANA_00075 [Escherichia coli]
MANENLDIGRVGIHGRDFYRNGRTLLGGTSENGK